MRTAALPRPDGADWTGLTTGPLPLAEAASWAARPECGAVVVFAGTVRDSAEGRTGVTSLEYEAYEEQVVPRLDAVAAEARTRWPTIGRLALLHRTGALALTEVSVVVAVSTPHRREAFAAASWCIDAVKSTVPIWKRERWDGGTDWATGSTDIGEIEDAAAR